MKKTKYILSTILIFVALIIYGESRSLNALKSIENTYVYAKYEIDRYKIEDDAAQIAEILNVVKSIANENGCSFFIEDQRRETDLSLSVNIYCYEEDADTIEKGFALKSNYIDSLILGNIKIEYKDIKDVPQINSSTVFRFVGELESIKETNRSLDEVIGKSSFITDVNNDNRYNRISFIIFGFVVFVISVFSFFQAGIERKEMAIRIVYGEKKTTLFLKNICCDCAVYMLIFVCVVLALSQVDNVCEDLSIILGFYFVIVLCNSLAYLGLLRTDAVLAVRGKKLDNKVLLLNYIMKFCASLTVIIAVSVFSQTIKSSEKYIKASKFFQSLSDYSFCYLEPECDLSDVTEYRENVVKLYETLYREYSDECEPVVLSHRKHEGNYIYANINALDYISSAVDSWDSKTDGFDFVIIQRNTQNTASKEFEIQQALDIIRMTEGLQDDLNYNIVTIDEDYQLVAFDSDLDEYFTFLDNPTIIINSRQPNDPICDIENVNHNSMYFSMLFKIDENIIDKLDKNVSIADYTITKSDELYQHYLNMKMIEFVFLGFLTSLLIILHIALIVSITRFEFIINKKELCIKKIIGYRLFSRYSYILVTTVVIDLMCLGIGIVLLKAVSVNAYIIALTTCVMLIITETLIICGNAAKLEKQSINKVLKDGAY